MQVSSLEIEMAGDFPVELYSTDESIIASFC